MRTTSPSKFNEVPFAQWPLLIKVIASIHHTSVNINNRALHACIFTVDWEWPAQRIHS